MGVLDGVLDRAQCAALREELLTRPLQRHDPRVRGDRVDFVPLLTPTVSVFEPARRLLAGIAPAIDRIAGGASGLLVPPAVQFAVYSPSTGYRPHRDNGPIRGAPGENYRELSCSYIFRRLDSSTFPDSTHASLDERLCSIQPLASPGILYLDERPESGRGGNLRCYVRAPLSTNVPSGRAVDVSPRPGRLVLFKSRQVLHEVTALEDWTRTALTLWLMRSPPTAPAPVDPAALRKVAANPALHPVFQ